MNSVKAGRLLKHVQNLKTHFMIFVLSSMSEVTLEKKSYFLLEKKITLNKVSIFVTG